MGKEPKMPSRSATRLMLLVVLAATSLQITAQNSPFEPATVEERLVDVASRLRFSLSVASFSIYAPTLADLRLHAQQLVNLLEGSSGRHYVRPAEPAAAFAGLLTDVVDLSEKLASYAVEPEIRPRIAAAVKNVSTYLGFALDAALSSLQRRRLDDAARDMMKAYAYLAAALERPLDASTVPGLWTILRLFGLTEAIDDTL